MLSLPQSSSRPTTIDDDDLSFYNNPDESLASKYQDIHYYNPPDNITTYSIEQSANINMAPISNPTQTHRHHSKSYSADNINGDHISINGYSTSSHSNTLHQQLSQTIQQSWQHQLSKSRNLTDVLAVDIFAESISNSNETPIEQIIHKNKNNIKKHKHKHKHRQNKSKTKTNTSISKLSPLPQLTPTDTELYGGPKPYFIKRKPTYNNPFSPKAIAKHKKHNNNNNNNNNYFNETMPVWHMPNCTKSNDKCREINKKYKTKSKSIQLGRKHKKRKQNRLCNYNNKHKHKPDVLRYKSTPCDIYNYHIVNDGDSVSQHEYFSHDDTVLF